MHSATIEFIESCFVRFEESKWKNLKKKDTKKLYNELLKKHQPVEIFKMSKIEGDSKEILYGNQKQFNHAKDTI